MKWDRESVPIGAAEMLIAMECSGVIDRYLHAYQDGGGRWTYGVGSTVRPDGKPVQRGDALTLQQAMALLDMQIDHWCDAIRAAVPASVPITDAQAATLVDLVHNMGPGCLASHTVIAEMLATDMLTRASRQLNGWCVAWNAQRGTRGPDLGLMRRREMGRRMWWGDVPLKAAQAEVWALDEGALLPLYQAACSDASRWRNGVVTWPVHSEIREGEHLMTTIAPALTKEQSDALLIGIAREIALSTNSARLSNLVHSMAAEPVVAPVAPIDLAAATQSGDI